MLHLVPQRNLVSMKHIYSLIGSFTLLKTMLRLLILVNGIILIPTILKGQNVGINQANPETKLHINTVEPSILGDVLKLDNGGGTTGTETGLVFETGVDRIARISASNESGDRGPLKFWTTSSIDNLIERMRITQDGYVGIGTTTPTSVLEIAKAQGNLLRIWRADNSSADINFLFSANRNGGDKLDVGQIKSIYENPGYGIENSAMAFHTMNIGTLTEKVRITKNGNVGIGTTAPAEKLHVSNGNIAINNTFKFKFSGSDSNWQLGYESGSPSSSFFGFTAAILQTVYGDDPNYGYIIENTQGNSVFEIEGQTGKTYLAGNVGIGIAPEAKMHINGNTSGAIQDVLKLDNEAGTAGTETGLVFEAGFDRLARISASHESNDRGPLKFWTTSSKDNLVERMRISQDGMVRVNDLAGTGTRFVVADANGNLSTGTSTTSGIITGSGTTNYVARWTPDGATLGTGLIHDDGVNVGIGTAAPSSLMHMKGIQPVFTIDDASNSNTGPEQVFVKADITNPHSTDEIGIIRYKGAGNIEYSNTVVTQHHIVNTHQSGKYVHNIRVDNALKNLFTLNGRNGGDGLAEIVFNEDATDADFRIESDTEVNALFVEGSSSRVGIGTATPWGQLHVSGGQIIADDNIVLNSASGKLTGGGGVASQVTIESSSSIAGTQPITFRTAGADRMTVAASGVVRVNNIAGTGNRPVYVDPSGNLVTTSSASNTPTSGYSLMDGTVWGTNEGTVRVVISGNTLYVRAYNEGGGLQNTHTINNVHNAKVLVTITNDDDGNSCGQVSRVLSFLRTNGQGEQSQSSDMGCPASDGHMQTIIIFFNPS